MFKITRASPRISTEGGAGWTASAATRPVSHTGPKETRMPQDNVVRHIDFASPTPRVSGEALFISSLIATGSYHPGTYGVGEHHFAGFKAVHEFCKDHQAKAGRAPTLELVRLKFPRFPFTEHIDPVWAAHDMIEAYRSRQLRKYMVKANELLTEDDVEGATGALKDGIKAATPILRRGTGISDFEDIEAYSEADRATVDFAGGLLQQYTNGIGNGELWYMAARLGVGKTWELLKTTIAAAEAGWNVVFFSLEMPSKAVKDRLHRLALRHLPTIGQIDLMPLRERRDLMEAWQATSGKVSVFDPTSGACDATRISAAAADTTLVIVDYVGLMRAASGERAISDWRAAASISNELKETALEYKMPIIAAAQINREGDKARKMDASHLSQSDAFGQDADVIVTMREFSTHVRVKHLMKNRHGVQGIKWYTRFDPSVAAFEDLSAERAHNLRDLDEEHDASQME
jgi:hypothetical protein